MSKRTVFTTITPLPPAITRDVALGFLHNHAGMIDLNPLVIERHAMAAPPPHAEPEERVCEWFSITDRIAYVPGLVEKPVTYSAAFYDLPDGLQTHSYAPMGLDLRSKWSVGGSMPGEPREPVEIGIGAPESGLYLREDVDMRCNFLLASFVKKTIQKGHGTLVDRLADQAAAIGSAQSSQRMSLASAPPGSAPNLHNGLHSYYAPPPSEKDAHRPHAYAELPDRSPYGHSNAARYPHENQGEGEKHMSQRNPAPQQQQPPLIPRKSLPQAHSNSFAELE